jgi:hypothetical protein
MSSSTSSSERAERPAGRPPRRPRALAVGLTTLLVLGAIELMTRLWLIPASKDLSRFEGYPARARLLVSRPGARVALIGNSATEEGVDPRLFASALSELMDAPVSAELFVADSAEIGTMYWMVHSAFWRQGLKPDLLVVTFFDRGLEDGAPLDVGRLARFFTERADVHDLFSLDLPRFDERAEWLVSSYSAAFAARRRLKERVLTLLPGYKSALGRVNQVNFEHDQSGRFAPADLPHEGLRRFVERALENHVQVCFVAYPKQDHYEVAPEARRIIADAGMLFLDLRDLPALAPEHYRDNIHLNEKGRPIYTKALARALDAAWRTSR